MAARAAEIILSCIADESILAKYSLAKTDISGNMPLLCLNHFNGSTNWMRSIMPIFGGNLWPPDMLWNVCQSMAPQCTNHFSTIPRASEDGDGVETGNRKLKWSCSSSDGADACSRTLNGSCSSTVIHHRHRLHLRRPARHQKNRHQTVREDFGLDCRSSGYFLLDQVTTRYFLRRFFIALKNRFEELVVVEKFEI